MKKNLLLLSLLAALALPAAALAQTTANVTVTGIVANVANVIWTVAVIIVVIFWVITGILFLAAMGDPGKLGTAKKALFAAVGGTVIVVLAYSATNIIENAIFQGQ